MRSPVARRAVITLLGFATAGVAVFLLSMTEEDEPAGASGSLLVANAGFPTAIAPLENGGFLYGQRLSGRIRSVDSDGNLRPSAIAAVEVSTTGQRGLLGLAVDRSDRMFAAWSRPDNRLVVGQLLPEPTRLVWVGPETTDLANGGHLAISPDGRLVIGIGDLRSPELVSDPTAPNGKLLALDPDGAPNQEPVVLSSGWNNPFAFTFAPGGDLWVGTTLQVRNRSVSPAATCAHP